MSCTRSHRIDLVNLRDGELVCHSVLLVRGYVQPPHCVPHNEQQQQRVQLTLRSQSEQITHLAVAPSPRGEFKFLIDLYATAATTATSCDLELCLGYCNAAETLQLRYIAQPASEYHVQPLYIRCADEGAADDGDSDDDATVRSACDKIDVNVRLVQCVYAEKLREAGFERRTFALNGACAVFTSQLTLAAAWRSSEDTLWQHFGRELLNSPAWSVHVSRLKFVAFIACTRYDGAAVVRSGDYSYASIRRHLHAHAALGGGGLALFGSAYFYAWPRRCDDVLANFRSDVAVDVATQPDDSNYRRTHGGVYASTLGAVVHEMGHIFDLPHTADGVMGKGFDLVNRVFTVAAATEHLPARVIHKGTLAAAAVATQSPRPRFTQLRREATNSFLDDYHEQRQRNDGFFFARNCAIILSHHRWFRPPMGDDATAAATMTTTAPSTITFDALQLRITASDAAAALVLVEVRAHANSLVSSFYEPPAGVLSFQLPEAVRAALESGTHHLYALAANGHMERFNTTTDSP